ncbi:hypothetical protein ACJX0J_005831 [Zea mays]
MHSIPITTIILGRLAVVIWISLVLVEMISGTIQHKPPFVPTKTKIKMTSREFNGESISRLILFQLRVLSPILGSPIASQVIVLMHNASINGPIMGPAGLSC